MEQLRKEMEEKMKATLELQKKIKVIEILKIMFHHVSSPR